MAAGHRVAVPFRSQSIGPVAAYERVAVQVADGDEPHPHPHLVFPSAHVPIVRARPWTGQVHRVADSGERRATDTERILRPSLLAYRGPRRRKDAGVRMSEDRIPSTGEAVARWRYRRQMTQEQLAEAAGLSVSAVKAIERGARSGRMATLHRLASALNVRTSDLLMPMPGVAVYDEDVGTDALHAIRQVLTPPLGLLPDPGPAPAPEVWRDTLRYAERLYDEDRYDAALAAVSVLLEEARALHAANPAHGDALAHAYLYAAQVLTQVRRLDLANHALGIAMDLAHDRSDEVLAAGTVMIQGWTLLLQRRAPEVEQLLLHAAELVEPRMSDAVSPRLAVWGWLMMRASAAAVRDARAEDADEYISQARAAAARLGEQPGQIEEIQRQLPIGVRGFSPTTVAYKDVENAVLRGESGRALELASRVPPAELTSPNNRDRHQLDLASAYLAEHRPADAIETMLAVRDTSPEWLRRQGYARDIVGQLVENRRRAYADEVGALADLVGVDH